MQEKESPPVASGPTDSHALSQAEQDDQCLTQKAGQTADTVDVGWGESPDNFDERIVSGLPNEDLWMLIRRFNKQIYYVKATSERPSQNLDLNRAEDEHFSPDKLRATLERLYTVIVVSLAGLMKHVARLRSWREPRRTSAFCAVYFVAWLLDLLVPTMLSVLLVLAIYPPSRTVLFPPAPIALVDKNTGGVQKPKAGVLGSHDSITGAPQNLKGEAAEKEASNLIASVASVVVGSVAGKHDQATPEDAPMETAVPDAMDVVSNAADAQSAARGEVPDESHDKTRQPMKETVVDAADQLMRVLSDIVDTYERLCNALAPTPPFSTVTPYVRLSSVLVSAIIITLFTSSYVFVKLSTLVLGLGLFGDPIILRAMTCLNHRYPNWTKFLLLQNSLLKGVPTNAQLTLTLLRLGEANTAPLPPPPAYALQRAPSGSVPFIPQEAHTLGATAEEIHDAASADLQPPQTPSDKDHSSDTKSPTRPRPKKTWFASAVAFFRGTTATGLESKLAIDRARAATGSRHAKSRVGVLRRKGRAALPAGPVLFDARYQGKHGAVVIDSESGDVSFTTDAENPEKHTLFSIPVSEIREMRKIGGLGWKGKLVAGWAVGSKEVVDGLVITGKEKSYRLTAMRMRDELFNRLVAMDGQVWKSY